MNYSQRNEGVMHMDAREFQEMPLLKRAEFINHLILKEGADEPLKKAAEAVGMSYSAFCKEMRRGGYTYSQSKKQYEKTLSIEEFKEIQSAIPNNEGNDEAMRFLASHLDEIKNLLITHKSQLILDPQVYDPTSESITKSFVVNKDIYDKFTELAATKFPHLRLRDIVSNCLLCFIKQYEETPSAF